MSFRKEDIICSLLLCFCSFLLVFDLLFSKGLPATFDGRMHTTMVAQFYRALSEGEIHATWADGFGNYGMPMPIFHQQVTSYVGAGINFVVHNAVVSTHIVYFIGAALSAIFLFFFLRIYFTPISALTGAILFNFSSYRIFNIYVRGAMPEFFASVSLPLLLIAIYFLVKKKKNIAFFLLIFSVVLIALTHPFLLIIYAFIFVPYLIFILFTSQSRIRKITLVTLAFVLGIGVSSYYLAPLLFEVKYLYYGAAENHFSPNQFMTISNYISNQWFYFYKDSPFVRGNFVPFGALESGIILSGLLAYIYQISKNKNYILLLSLIVIIPLVFFTTKYSEIFYKNISLLGNIQHPWRLFSSLIFIPPVILASLLEKLSVKRRMLMACALILLIGILRFPQLYSKNSTLYPNSHYSFTKDNVAAVVLNPIWTGRSEEYPLKKNKIEIINGEGTITKSQVTNSTRQYEIDAISPLRVVDYTFYFPGWNLYIDGKNAPIEYQDQDFRGVITYNVPTGKHSIKILFENTKIREAANIISILFLMVIILLYIMMKSKFNKLLFLNEK